MISSERLVIRNFTSYDISADYLSALNDKLMQRYSRNQFLEHTCQSCLSYLESFTDTPNYFLAATSLSDSSLVGTCTCYYTEHHRRFDLGIMILPKYHRRGYASELLNSVSRFLFMEHDLTKLTAGTPSTHKAMISVLQSSNFELEAQIPNHFLTIDGSELPVNLYARYS